MLSLKERAERFVAADVARGDAEASLIEDMRAQECETCIIGAHLLELEGGGEPDDAFILRREAPRRLE